MIKIAVCDDENKIANELEEMLYEIAKEHLLKISVDVFFDGQELYDELLNENNYFDIIFLDILMKQMNGTEFSDILRYEMDDEHTKIVFISWEKDFSFELHKFRPHDFIVKPVKRNILQPTFLRATKLLERSSTYFKYQKQYETYKIDTKLITHFSISGRKVVIHTLEKENYDEFTGKILDVEEELRNLSFFFIHKSYLANYFNVKILSTKKAIFKNDFSLPVSKSHRDEINRILLYDKDIKREGSE